MDFETIESYDQQAEAVAELHTSLVPETIYELIETYFHKKKSTCDLGCGCGRDTKWLSDHGFRAIGVDASTGMIREAQKRFSKQLYVVDALPYLSRLKDRRFANVLCSAVLMHLPLPEIPIAIERIFQLLDDRGRLILSYRGTSKTSGRENGKLYINISREAIEDLIIANAGLILESRSEIELGRRLLWHTFVVEKT